MKLICLKIQKEDKMVDFVDLMSGRNFSLDNEKEQDEFFFSEQWRMEPVLFGVRIQCLVNSVGEFKFLGKKKDYKQQDILKFLPDIVESLKTSSIPSNSLFEGNLELGNRADVYRFLKTGQSRVKATFHVSDIIYYDNKDVFNQPLFDRLKLMQRIFREDNNIRIQQGYVKNKKKEFERLRELYTIFLFKDLESIYNFKQSVACRIYKIPRSFFMVIMGIVENQNNEKLKNMVVALEGGQVREGKLEKIMNIPINGNDSKISLYDARDSIIGKVFEFLALEKSPEEKKYQDVRFVKIRNDKTVEDCVF